MKVAVKLLQLQPITPFHAFIYRVRTQTCSISQEGGTKHILLNKKMSPELLWLTLGGSYAPHTDLLMAQGKRKGRVKARELVGQDKKCLISEREEERQN